MEKHCCRCKEVKDIICFTKDQSRVDGRDNECRECKKISNKNKRQRFKVSGKMNQWIDKNRENINTYHNEWLAKHPGYCRKYVLKNIMLYRMFAIEHFNKRKRELGFVPLNPSFEGSEGHHIGRDYVIFIPKELHRSVYHNFFKGTNIKEINALALDYLFTSATI